MSHFRKYYALLVALTALLVVASFVVQKQAPQNFIVALPLTALYFAIVTGLQHWFVVNSTKKDPRTFIRNFLGATIGVLFLHLVVMATYMFTHMAQAKIFVVGFCIGYAAYLVFETVALILFVRNARKKQD
ncbi:MAG: hypothetical protein IJ789_02040 [Bacteroidales bacterium]|nr:hypothetical protein [Bacteroidales bacterium]